MRYSTLVVLFVISSCISQEIQSNNTKSLSIGCFLPGYLDNDYFGYATALEMARNWINNNHILPENYTLELDCRETLVRRNVFLSNGHQRTRRGGGVQGTVAPQLSKNRPFSYSEKESQSNDTLLHFIEFSNVHNSDRSSNASRSNLVYKMYKNNAQPRLFYLIAKRSIIENEPHSGKILSLVGQKC